MPQDTLPAAVDAQSPLSPSELSVLRSQYNSESAKGWVSVQTKFNLSWGLVKSNDRVEVGEGVGLLMVGLAIAGGAATVAGLVLTALLSGGRRR
ncbi:hypothetical protein P7C70_g1735, partial [Phenoliferia sp. Uapishka_3]